MGPADGGTNGRITACFRGDWAPIRTSVRNPPAAGAGGGLLACGVGRRPAPALFFCCPARSATPWLERIFGYDDALNCHFARIAAQPPCGVFQAVSPGPSRARNNFSAFQPGTGARTISHESYGGEGAGPRTPHLRNAASIALFGGGRERCFVHVPPWARGLTIPRSARNRPPILFVGSKQSVGFAITDYLPQ